jgi:putative serine protease PepD
MTDEPGGVRLSGVRSGSPADSAGMREGDILVGLGEHPITNLQDFQNALMSHAAGDRVEVRYRRGADTVRVMVTLGGRGN